MKHIKIIIGVAIATSVFTAFGCVNKKQENEALIASSDSTKQNSNTNQPLYFFIHGSHNQPITKDKLVAAKTLGDFRPHYPTNWIEEYIEVEISVIQKGEEIITKSQNDTLTVEQIKLINSLKLEDDINIAVKYKSINAVTNKLENRQIDISYTVVPMVKAEYIGGYDELIKYLEENSFPKVSNNQIQEISIFFNVNENGEIKNIELARSSGNTEIDDLLIHLLSEMPKWKPAKNANEIAVSQQFELNLGGC